MNISRLVIARHCHNNRNTNRRKLFLFQDVLKKVTPNTFVIVDIIKNIRSNFIVPREHTGKIQKFSKQHTAEKRVEYNINIKGNI